MTCHNVLNVAVDGTIRLKLSMAVYLQALQKVKKYSDTFLFKDLPADLHIEHRGKDLIILFIASQKQAGSSFQKPG